MMYTQYRKVLYEQIGKVGCQKQVNFSGVTMRGEGENAYEVVRLVDGQEFHCWGVVA